MINVYAAMRAGAALEPFQYAPNELGSMSVEIEISHCGVCHSDLHLIDNDWGVSAYPLVPGHEIVGTITGIGNAVRHLRIGQRVGVGWLAGSCMACEQCLNGNENLCRQAQPTCIGRHGGYASSVIVDARFVLALPEELKSEHAAPLLCAGITVFAPLRRQRLNAKARVGIVGVGGLGHLALQFARAMGYSVTAFSTSMNKQEEARSFGADRFVDTSALGALNGEASSCDFVLSTVSADLPWVEYLNLLKPNGHLCLVGASPGELRVLVFPLIEAQKSIGGSAIGSNAELAAMLDFSAEHKISPLVESFSMTDANAAMVRLRKNQLRYRAVLVNDR